MTGSIDITESGNTACENQLTTGLAGASVNLACTGATAVLVTTTPPSAGLVTSVNCTLVGVAIRVGTLVVVTLTGSLSACNALACISISMGPVPPLVAIGLFTPDSVSPTGTSGTLAGEFTS